MRNLILVAAGIIVLGTLLFFNQPQGQVKSETDSVGNILTADKAFHDFGTISMKNGNVKTTFTIRNTTSEAITVNKLYTTCMCTKAKFTVSGRSFGPFGMPGHGALETFSQKLEPNQEGTVEVEYDPNAHGPSGIGTVERSIILEGGNEPLITLNIKANVKP